MSGSDNGDVFQVNRQYFSGGLNLVLGLLTDYLFLETRSAHLILWVFERGAQKYGKLIEVHSARQENEQAIRDARREAENLVQEFERKHYEMLHTLFHDRRMQDARAEKLMNFCESSWHIADNGTLEDKKTVEKRWSNGLERAKAVWEVFKNMKDEVEKRNEELHELYKKFRIVEGSVLRFPNQTYSERDVREVVEVAFSLEVIQQRTEELLRQKQKEETRRRLKLGHADARIDELLKDTVKHKEAVDKDVQKASRKPSGASQSNQTETHVEYKVEIEIASESISRTIRIQDGQPAMFCDVNTERIAYRPQRGLSPTLQAELEICDALVSHRTNTEGRTDSRVARPSRI